MPSVKGSQVLPRRYPIKAKKIFPITRLWFTAGREVYLLKDKKFVLDDVYRIFPDYVELSADEQEQYKSEVLLGAAINSFILSLSTLVSSKIYLNSNSTIKHLKSRLHLIPITKVRTADIQDLILGYVVNRNVL